MHRIPMMTMMLQRSIKILPMMTLSQSETLKNKIPLFKENPFHIKVQKELNQSQHGLVYTKPECIVLDKVKTCQDIQAYYYQT